MYKSLVLSLTLLSSITAQAASDTIQERCPNPSEITQTLNSDGTYKWSGNTMSTSGSPLQILNDNSFYNNQDSKEQFILVGVGLIQFPGDVNLDCEYNVPNTSEEKHLETNDYIFEPVNPAAWSITGFYCTIGTDPVDPNCLFQQTFSSKQKR